MVLCATSTPDSGKCAAVPVDRLPTAADLADLLAVLDLMAPVIETSHLSRI